MFALCLCLCLYTFEGKKNVSYHLKNGHCFIHWKVFISMVRFFLLLLLLTDWSSDLDFISVAFATHRTNMYIQWTSLFISVYWLIMYISFLISYLLLPMFCRIIRFVTHIVQVHSYWLYRWLSCFFFYFC